MASVPFPAPSELRRLLRYEPESGKLFWLKRPRELFTSDRICNAWNSKLAGKEAFTAESNGYRVGRINDRMCMAHRAIWAIAHGYWPEHDIDHINGEKSDNRLINLREASRSENNCNSGLRADNRSGYRGVSWHAQYGKWEARIYADRKKYHLGYYDTAEQAAEAYRKASPKIHGEFSRVA